MTSVLIGSKALQVGYPAIFRDRKMPCKDVDLIVSKDEAHGGIHDTKYSTRLGGRGPVFEVEVEGHAPSTKMILEADESLFLSKRCGVHKVANLELQFALKSAHKYRDSPHFFKTWHDWHLMRKWAAFIDPEAQPIFQQRAKEVAAREPSISGIKEDFFQGDFRPMDHDKLHGIVASAIGFKEPAFYSILKEGEAVAIDPDKWHDLHYMDQIRCAWEEITVLAFERSIIPYGATWPKGWRAAYRKVCTTLTKGMFRKFCYLYGLSIWNFANDPKVVDQIAKEVKNHVQ